MREKNGMSDPPCCFFCSSVQALTLQFGSFLSCLAMPGILCLWEIRVTCQSSIKRGNILTLTFNHRLGRAVWERGKMSEGQRVGVSEKNKSVPSVSVQCPVSQAHPKLILHLLCFLVLSRCLPHPSPCSHLSSLTPPATELLKRQSMTLTVSGVFPPRCLIVCLPQWNTLKAKTPNK